MECSYCSTPIIEGRSIRKRRVDSIIEEIAHHVEAGFSRFSFVDNVFNMPSDFAFTPLSREATELGVIHPADDLLHPRFYMTVDLMEWLYDSVRAWIADRNHWML
jgi:radical SAM superfamily enzyme YgiQ (UPF0313 family)